MREEGGGQLFQRPLLRLFRVARLTLQTPKTLVGRSVWRLTVAHVTFDLPECKEPFKTNKEKENEKTRKKKREKWKMKKQ